jgi:hypothetical protein
MCEFCSLGPNSNHDPDSRNANFSGFFSADAIQAAVEQAAADKKSKAKPNTSDKKEETGEEDDDGT